MKKSVRKEFVLTPVEAQDLKKKAQGACVAEARLLRMLIAGYQPPEKPNERFYEAMSQVAEFAEKVESLSLFFSDPAARKMLEQEAERWRTFQAEIERRFLMPERRNDYWL